MTQIAVVGCGIIGLTTAVRIQEQLKNAQVTIYTEEKAPKITSDVAAGLVLPYLLENTKIEDVMKWTKLSVDYFMKLIREGHCDDAGVYVQPVYKFFSEGSVPKPEWASVILSYEELTQDQLNVINRERNKNYRKGMLLVTVVCEPRKFIKFNEDLFKKNGGEIVIRKIEDFSELSQYDVIVNCTGVNARDLALDNELQAVRGQVIRVRAPWQYIAHLEEDANIYVIPNSEWIVLGGTAQKGNYNKVATEPDKKHILEGCSSIVPALKHAPILSDEVGLRPYRSKVRLEIEIKRSRGKTLKIIHNYGHGGSGVTFSYGCSVIAANLVKDVLNSQRNKL